jgi:hypothetical protein
MSLINGDRSRAGRQRKTKFEKRARNRILRQSLTPKAPAVPVTAAPVTAPVTAVTPAAIIAATVVAAAIPVAIAARMGDKKSITQYPRRKAE